MQQPHPTHQSPDPTSEVAPGITFASVEDALRYQALGERERILQAELAAIEGEKSTILRRARWWFEALQDG